MKKLSPITLCWVSILGCIIFIAVLCIRGDRSQSINYNNIRKIQLGIAKEDVLSILGMPSAVDGDTFKYTQKALPFGCYSKLWVHFESNCVREVYGKKKKIYFGMKRMCIGYQQNEGCGSRYRLNMLFHKK